MNLLKEIAGQPAHPVFVHFPIACFTLATVFLWLHLMDGSPHRVNGFLERIRVGPFDFEKFSFAVLLIGVGMGVVAILSGLSLVGGFKNIPIPHAPWGLATVICYAVLLALRWLQGPALHTQPVRFLYYGLSFAGIVLLALAGFAGGELHYEE